MRRNSAKNRSSRGNKKDLQPSKTLIPDNGDSEQSGGFHACYLLTSLCPRYKGHTYIGFTVNPKRRIRQHNGEITCGATRTKRRRPWEMVLCIYGFPTQVAALQFEWAWQHPTESIAVRGAACSLKSLSGLANKIKVAFTMLTLHTWQSMDLTVNFFSTKYMSHVAACLSLPRQMKVQFGSMDDLPCYSSADQFAHNDEDDWDLDPHESPETNDLDQTRNSGSQAVDQSEPQDHDFPAPSDPIFVQEDDNCQEFDSPVCRRAEESAEVEDECVPIEAQLPTSKQIEVIDLFTPSPSNDCKNNNTGCKKKRNVVSNRSEIIDLTRSPDFIQL